MDPIVSSWFQLVARWLHVIGGVVWIGFLFFFALVQIPAIEAMGEARREAARQLMPRALWWFRWMAALTLLTGLALLWMVYYFENTIYRTVGETSDSATLVAVLGALASVVAYDAILARVAKPIAEHTLSIALLATVFWLFDAIAAFNGRAVWMHVGSVMGLALFVNVWGRVWPAARTGVLPALAAGTAPSPEAMAMIVTRARRSVYVAVPLLLLMISNHYPILYGSSRHAIYFALLMVAGWLFALAFLRRAAGFTIDEEPKGGREAR